MKKLYLSTLGICIYFISVAQSCPGTGAINFQRWNNISGSSVSNLTSNPNYPDNPSSTGTRNIFEMQQNLGNNIGIRMNGYICPPITGNYVFWIASDASGELWLSTTSDPANKVRIAFNTSATKYRQWNKYASQKSVTKSLVANQLYYVEALMKESNGSDNLSVGWSIPGQSVNSPSEVIPGTSLLTRLPDNQPPTAPSNLGASYITTTSFLLTWDASTDNIGVTGYDVFQNGSKINSTNIIGTSYSVTGLSPSTTYSMMVVAKDGDNQTFSSQLSVATISITPANESFSVRTVIANQNMPHDLVYGPDGKLWYTERFAGNVNFVNPASGAKTTVLTLGSSMVQVGGQDGLMGLALHPDFLNGKPYVYISYTYQSLSSTVRKTRIERYTYNSSTQTLQSPVTILQDIPGSNDHNSARIAIGPDLKLYYSVGDMGAGQFDNATRTNNAQNVNIYEGKILRLNTEPDGGGSWIPSDNPFTNGGQPTAVFSLGHRNPQGLVWGNVNGTDILYSSEHGPWSDDEVNIIERARNYGWPQVAGFCDGNYNGRTIGGFAVANEQTNCATLNAKEPLRSIFPDNNPPSGGDFMTWPTIAPCGTDFYGSNAIPGWQNSLLIATLKSGKIVRYQLSNDGQAIISDVISYFTGQGRYRDVVVSPDGLKIYVACDNIGNTSGPTGNVLTTPPNPGSILEFTYDGSGSTINRWMTQSQIQEDKNDKTVDVYPNPASNFVVVYSYKPENRRILLYDMNGRIVRNVQTNELATRINILDLKNGLYILSVKGPDGKNIRTEKVVVVR